MTGEKTVDWIISPAFGAAKRESDKTARKMKKASAVPMEPEPRPEPAAPEEVAIAKKKVKGKKRGRPSTILAGRLMDEHGKKILGE